MAKIRNRMLLGFAKHEDKLLEYRVHKIAFILYVLRWVYRKKCQSAYSFMLSQMSRVLVAIASSALSAG